MEALSFDDVVSAVVIANAATALFIFGFIRLRNRNEFDWWSAGSILVAAALVLPSLYYSI